MISFVIPVYNEEESILAFYKELKLEAKRHTKYEIIFVDDGSKDKSLHLLKSLAKKDSSIKIYSFRKNLGKSEALTLGFQKASGEYIITLDADLQDKPSEVRKLLAKAMDGNDLVSGWRKNRQDSTKKIISSKIFNQLVGIFWDLKLHDYNCGLKVYSKEAAKSLRLYGGLHRFIPLLLFNHGFLIVEVPVEHDIRKYGKSKYGFSKLWKDLPDIFTMIFLTRYSERPLHFFGWMGGLLTFLGILVLFYLTILHLLGQGIGDRPLLFLGMLLLISGFQVLFTGFLADLIINISRKETKTYSLKEIIE